MKLFELLEKVYNRNLEDLPRRIKYIRQCKRSFKRFRLVIDC